MSVLCLSVTDAENAGEENVGHVGGAGGRYGAKGGRRSAVPSRAVLATRTLPPLPVSLSLSGPGNCCCLVRGRILSTLELGV